MNRKPSSLLGFGLIATVMLGAGSSLGFNNVREIRSEPYSAPLMPSGGGSTFGKRGARRKKPKFPPNYHGQKGHIHPRHLRTA